MPTGVDTTTDDSIAGMDGAHTTTHGIIHHGMAHTAFGMTLGSTVMADGMADGTTPGFTAMRDGMEDGTPTTIGDGMVTTILYMAAVAAPDTMALVVPVLPIMAMVLMADLNRHSVLDAASVPELPTGIEATV